MNWPTDSGVYFFRFCQQQNSQYQDGIIGVHNGGGLKTILRKVAASTALINSEFFFFADLRPAYTE